MGEQARLRALALLDDPRWAAVLARAAAADGRFYYAVRSTGVYCRPSCGARTPRPENVAFFASTAAAAAAGFRPCRRCRPDQASLQQRQASLVAELCRQIDQAETAPNLQQLAQQAGLSRFHLLRLFRAHTGLTPAAYAAGRRAERLRLQLGQGANVTAAMYAAGYNASSRFYAAAGAQLGMKPAVYRAGGAGETIRFAVGECSLGAILVAASERGVCAILLGDDAGQLLHDLQRRFHRAELLGADAGFEQQVAQVVGLVEQPQLGHALPLDLRGTTFQLRVWQALLQIPPGSTLSYSELAQRIGQPGSARAVAKACGANPLAVVIPCHRVVRTDGGLAGYRWGIERKQALLLREAGPPAG